MNKEELEKQVRLVHAEIVKINMEMAKLHNHVNDIATEIRKMPKEK